MTGKQDLAALSGTKEARAFPGLDTCEDPETIDASSGFGSPPRATP